MQGRREPRKLMPPAWRRRSQPSNNTALAHLCTVTRQEVGAWPAPAGTTIREQVFNVERFIVIGAARMGFHCTMVGAGARSHGTPAREVLGSTAELRNILVHAHLGARAEHAHPWPIARLAKLPNDLRQLRNDSKSGTPAAPCMSTYACLTVRARGVYNLLALCAHGATARTPHR